MTGDLFDLPEARVEAGGARPPTVLGEGAFVFPGMALTVAPDLLAAIPTLARKAPFMRLETPGGRRMSVEMTACGALGWYSDRRGYRYTPVNPETGRPWPQIPDVFATLVRQAAEAAGFAKAPLQSCLINRYSPGTRLSLHQDRDEGELATPIVSVSLGKAATFLWGGLDRDVPARRIRLQHGDVVVWGGPSRLVFHGVAPLAAGEHPLTGPYRFNLTFRQVEPQN